MFSITWERAIVLCTLAGLMVLSSINSFTGNTENDFNVLGRGPARSGRSLLESDYYPGSTGDYYPGSTGDDYPGSTGDDNPSSTGDSGPPECVASCPCLETNPNPPELCGCVDSCVTTTCSADELAVIQQVKDVCAAGDPCAPCKDAEPCFTPEACGAFNSSSQTWSGLYAGCNEAVACAACFNGGCADVVPVDPCAPCEGAKICFTEGACGVFNSSSQAWSGPYVGCNVNATSGTGAMDCVPGCIAAGCPVITDSPTVPPTEPPTESPTADQGVNGASAATIPVTLLLAFLAVLLA